MMNFAEAVARLERRIAALESNRGASLRFGKVCGVEGGSARVQLPDGQGMVTAPLPVVQRRVLRDQDIKMPDMGEPVAILSAGQGMEAGVVLGACYSEAVPDPAQEPQCDYHRYADGTVLCYDRTAHKLTATIEGDVEMLVRKNLTAQVMEKASITAEQDVDVESKTRIRLKAPQILLQGNLAQEGYAGGAATSELRGGFTVREGGIAVPDNDVSAGAVSLRGHVHANSGGSGNSGTPVNG